MADLARLVIAADTSSLVTARKHLREVADEGDRTGRSFRGLMQAFKGSSVGNFLSDFKAGFAQGFWSEFSRGAKSGDEGVRQVSDSLGFAQRGASGLLSLMSSLASTVSFGALLYSIKAVIDGMDGVAKSAQKVGSTAPEFSKLSYAASISDVEVGSLQNSLITLNDRLSDIASGRANEASRALRAMGVSVFEADGSLKSIDEILLSVAGKFERYNDGAQKVAIANALFGRSGREMIPFLNQGADAIDELKERAEKLGLTISTETAQDADKFNDSMEDMQFYILGVARTAVSELLPALNDISGGVLDLIPDARELGKVIGVELKQSMADFISIGLEGAQVLRSIGTLATAFSSVSMNGGLFSEEGARVWGEALNSIKNDAANTRNEITKLYNTVEDPTGILASIDKSIERSSGKGDRELFRKVDAPSYNVPNPNKPKKEKKDPDLAEAKRLFESMATPMEAHKMRLDGINKLLDKGYISQETSNRAIQDSVTKYVNAQGALVALTSSQEDAKKSIDEYRDAVETVKNTTKGFFDDLKSGIEQGKGLWASLRDSALGALSSISSKLLNSGIDGLVEGIFSQGGHPLYGGGGGSILGSLFDGFFAKGGNIKAGKVGLVGEGGGWDHAELVQGPASVTPVSELLGSKQTVNYAPVYQVSGGVDEAALKRTQAAALADFESRIPSMIAKHARAGAL